MARVQESGDECRRSSMTWLKHCELDFEMTVLGVREAGAQKIARRSRGDQSRVLSR